MREETKYRHYAVEEAARATAEALRAGEDVAMVSADNRACWAAAHLALGTGTEIGTDAAAPGLIEIGGPIGEDTEPMLGSIAMWIHMVGLAQHGKRTTVAQIRAIDNEMCANDHGDFGARHAARAMHAAGTRTVLWLHADHFAEAPPPPGAARLIEALTGPLGAEGIRSILCFEGMVTDGWTPRIECPANARPVHLARYASPLDTSGAIRSEQVQSEDLEHVAGLVHRVAAGEGHDARSTIGIAEADALCRASAGCARMLIEWTFAAARKAGTTTIEFNDFVDTAPDPMRTSALLRCAEGAERTMAEMCTHGREREAREG